MVDKKTGEMKKRRTPRRKPVYLLTSSSLGEAGIELLGATTDTEEAMEILSKNPGASFVKVEPSKAPTA